MERFTYRAFGGTAVIKDGTAALKPGDSRTVYQAIDRLAAYEDTGLEPEEIVGPFDAMKARLYDVEQKLDRYRQAEQEGRLVVLPDEKIRWVQKILAERDRQDEKWGFPQINTWCEWSSILAEEAGELAQELNELNFGRGDMNRMAAEAVQVAAVALSILEHQEIAKEFTEKVMVARQKMMEADAALAERERGRAE